MWEMIIPSEIGPIEMKRRFPEMDGCLTTLIAQSGVCCHVISSDKDEQASFGSDLECSPVEQAYRRHDYSVLWSQLKSF